MWYRAWGHVIPNTTAEVGRIREELEKLERRLPEATSHRDLERDEREWKREKAKYQLVAPVRGVSVYVLKPEVETMDEPHWLCPTCFDHRQKKSILQRHDRHVNRHAMVCHHCCSRNNAAGMFFIQASINPGGKNAREGVGQPEPMLLGDGPKPRL